MTTHARPEDRTDTRVHIHTQIARPAFRGGEQRTVRHGDRATISLARYDTGLEVSATLDGAAAAVSLTTPDGRTFSISTDADGEVAVRGPVAP